MRKLRHMRSSFPLFLYLSLAGLLAMTLTGCETSRQAQPVNLPPAPVEFGAKVSTPVMQVGDNPKAVAARLAAALAVANRRLDNDYLWYEDVRAKYGKPTP